MPFILVFGMDEHIHHVHQWDGNGKAEFVMVGILSHHLPIVHND